MLNLKPKIPTPTPTLALNQSIYPIQTPDLLIIIHGCLVCLAKSSVANQKFFFSYAPPHK